MGSENHANMVAQMNHSDREQLFSQSWDGSNISIKILKKQNPGAHEKKRPPFHMPWCHGARQNALILPHAFPVSAAAIRT